MRRPPRAVIVSPWTEPPKRRSDSQRGAAQLRQPRRIEVYCEAPLFEACKVCWEAARKPAHWQESVECQEPGHWRWHNVACDPSPGLSSLSNPNLRERCEPASTDRNG